VNFDLTIWGPILGALIPFLLPMFPGLKNILAIVPKGVWAAMIKAVDPGATLTWSVSAASRRGELETRRAKLLAKVAANSATPEDEAALERTGAELAALPAIGGILDTLKANPMLIVAIVGGIILFTSQGGGCKKQPPNPQPGPPPAVTK